MNDNNNSNNGNGHKPLSGMRFESVLQAEVPKGRDGKHKQIISQLLADIAQLERAVRCIDASALACRGDFDPRYAQFRERYRIRAQG